jgi:hypothetical protein
MMRCKVRWVLLCAVALVSPMWSQSSATQQSWSFAVSGDSRNCGDVIMPAIAQRSKRERAQFYWHLGDLRAIYNVDEDMQKIAELQKKPFTVSSYEQAAWDDFIQNQVVPFGDTPFFIGIGNHETLSPKTRENFVMQFADWLNADPIREQRLLDHPDRSLDKRESVGDHEVRTYYHWVMNGVDFINLDNASEDQFTFPQVQWFKDVVQHDARDPEIHAVVVGMHAALPESFSRDHSMNDWSGHEWHQGEASGKDVYLALVDFRNTTHKPVYLLASHSHFFMDDLYDTQYWRDQHAVLPGWIIGTAGAQQHTLPPDRHPTWKDHAYGFLLGTAHSDGTIDFRFVELDRERDIPREIKERYTTNFVDWCYENNRKADGQPHGH